MPDEYDDQTLDAEVVEPPKPNIAPRPPAPQRPANLAPIATPMARTEVAQVGAQAAAVIARDMQMLQLQVQLAMHNPRHEDTIVGQVMQACTRKEFAEKALYSFPVKGAGTVLARRPLGAGRADGRRGPAAADRRRA